MGETILREDLVDEGPIPVLSATESEAIFGYVDAARVLLSDGDLVIPARGNSIGHPKLVKQRCTTTQTTIYCKPLSDVLLATFVYYYFTGLRQILFFFDRTAIPQLTVSQRKERCQVPFIAKALPKQPKRYLTPFLFSPFLF